MDSLINDCFKLESQSFSLNYSDSRRMKVVVDSVYPTVKITLRLVAVDHNCHVEMSKKTFCRVMRSALKAISCMKNERETEIFGNEYINVFTECMHDKCAICFVDQRGERVNMMVKTFKNMQDKEYAIKSECTAIYNKINSTAAKFKLIVDKIFAKMEQSQVDEEFKNFVSGIKQHFDTLSTLKAPPEQPQQIGSDDSDDSNDEDDSDYLYYEYEPDEDRGCYKCGCTCRNRW